MTWLIVTGGSFALLGLLLLLDGRRRERRVVEDWELALSPKGEQALRTAESHTRAQLAVVDLTFARAKEASDIGHTQVALRLLDDGCRAIEEYCPSMLRSLAAMTVLSRMVAAMAPARPLRPARFRSRQLTQLAYLNQFLHHFVLTTGERFRLRIHILARGFATLMRVMARIVSRVKVAPRAEPDWRQLDMARMDAHALNRESLESFRTLLVSLAAERRV